MQPVRDIAELEAIYGQPSSAAVDKVANHVTPLYWQWISASRFCVIATVGPDGTDGSPRGDDGPVVQMRDPSTLLMPDWRGNNRMDTLRNIVADGRISLMFMVPGSNMVIRVNGTAVVTLDDGYRARFALGGKLPRSVIVVTVQEVYSQCARALSRAELWTAPDTPGLPSMGALLAEQTQGAQGGADYDAEQAKRMQQSMW